LVRLEEKENRTGRAFLIKRQKSVGYKAVVFLSNGIFPEEKIIPAGIVFIAHPLYPGKKIG
jgi:hypothetical protein